jgi:hypothetical protein
MRALFLQGKDGAIERAAERCHAAEPQQEAGLHFPELVAHAAPRELVSTLIAIIQRAARPAVQQAALKRQRKLPRPAKRPALVTQHEHVIARLAADFEVLASPFARPE